MIETQIELRHLRYFVALADELHFTRASVVANISQPTLSQQIRQLEHAFGSRLVDRIGKKVSLTAAGTALLPHARSVLHQLHEAKAAVGEVSGLRSGRLALAVVQTVNATLIPQLLARYSESYPGIQVSTREVTGDELERGIEAGEFDLGLGFVPTGRATLETEALYEEELVGIVPRGHPLAQAGVLTFTALAEHPLVLLPRGYCTRELIQTSFTRAGVAPRIAMELNSVEGILATIQRTGAVTILPALALDRRLSPTLTAVGFKPPAPRRKVGLVWRKGAFRKAVANAFADLARSVATELKPARRVPPL
jgi:LysR family transcriptional regulator, cyn operon transcriptional activator